MREAALIFFIVFLTSSTLVHGASDLIAFVSVVDPGNWASTLTATDANSRVKAVVVRPTTTPISSGPGTSRNTTFAGMMQTCKSAGIAVLGYVATSGRSKTIGSVLSEIDQYRSFYGSELSGFYVDSVTAPSVSSLSDAALKDYDDQVSQRVRGVSSSATLYVSPRGRCESTTSYCTTQADVVIAWEGNFNEFVSRVETVPVPFNLNGVVSSQQLGNGKFAVVVWSATNATAARSVVVQAMNISIKLVSANFAPQLVGSSDSPSANLPSWYFSVAKMATYAEVLLKQTTRRGLYVSVDTATEGQNVYNSNASWIINERILLNATRQQLLLDRMVAQQFNAMSMYNLFGIMADTTKTALLRDFLALARTRGIETIEAIADDTLAAWDRIAAYQNASKGNSSQMFDGIVTEIEFWNGGTVADCTNSLRYIQNLRPQTRFVTVPFTYSVYIGWPTVSDIDALIQAGVTGLMIHVYVKNPSTAAGYASTRMQNIFTRGMSSTVLGSRAATDASWVGITPIFSAEGLQVAAGAEHFMGDWMQNNEPNSIAKAEAITMSGMLINFPWAKGQLSGFQWYSDFYVRVYTRSDTTAPPTTTTGAVSTTTTTQTPGTTTTAAVTTANPATSVPLAAASTQRIVIPGYFYPTEASWTTLTNVTSNQATRIFIANPNSGPGTSVDPLYQSGIVQLQSKGYFVVGYVYSSYGARNSSAFFADVDAYLNFYPSLQGIFIDEASDSDTQVPYYTTLYQGIVSRFQRLGKKSYVMLNPGTNCSEAYMNISDSIVIFENPYSTFSTWYPPAWAGKYDSGRLCAMLTGCPASPSFIPQTIQKLQANNVGLWYLTNLGGSNPYLALPSYWSDEVGFTINMTQTSTLSPDSSVPSPPASAASTSQPTTATPTTSTITITTTPRPPLRTRVPSTVRTTVRITIRLRGSGYQSLLNSRRAELIAALKQDLARILGVPLASIVINSLTIGSLVIDCTVASDTGLTATDTDSAIAASGTSGFTDTQALYGTVSTTDTVEFASSATVDLSSTPRPTSASGSMKCGSLGGVDCQGMIVGLSLALGAILVTGIILFVRSRIKGQSAKESDQDAPGQKVPATA